MATCRAIITSALRSIGAIAIGDDPIVEELSNALLELQSLLLELHEGRGPMVDVDLSATTYIAGENQRIRVQVGDTATITLPNSVPQAVTCNPNDYGFSLTLSLLPPQGSAAVANGTTLRQPRDWARVEMVGTAQALYWYRADTNAWVQASALTLDAAMPTNARYDSALTAILADRLIIFYPNPQLAEALKARVARARTTIFMRPGTARDITMAEFI